MKDIPAFPVPPMENCYAPTGMTLRDYFAAKAMAAYCADEDWRSETDPKQTAIAAYFMADAMLAARKAK